MPVGAPSGKRPGCCQLVLSASALSGQPSCRTRDGMKSRDDSLIDLRNISLTLVWCCLITMDFPGGGDAATSRLMQVASLPTVAGRATLQVMMQGSATGAGGGGLGQGLICLIGRGALPAGLPYQRPAAAGR
jgi:hypothetical protein